MTFTIQHNGCWNLTNMYAYTAVLNSFWCGVKIYERKNSNNDNQHKTQNDLALFWRCLCSEDVSLGFGFERTVFYVIAHPLRQLRKLSKIR